MMMNSHSKSEALKACKTLRKAIDLLNEVWLGSTQRNPVLKRVYRYSGYYLLFEELHWHPSNSILIDAIQASVLADWIESKKDSYLRIAIPQASIL